MATPKYPADWKREFEPLGATFISVVVQDVDGEPIALTDTLDQWGQDPDGDDDEPGWGTTYRIENPRPVADLGADFIRWLFDSDVGYHRGNVVLRPGMVIHDRAYPSSEGEDLVITPAYLREVLGVSQP